MKAYLEAGSHENLVNRIKALIEIAGKGNDHMLYCIKEYNECLLALIAQKAVDAFRKEEAGRLPTLSFADAFLTIEAEIQIAKARDLIRAQLRPTLCGPAPIDVVKLLVDIYLETTKFRICEVKRVSMKDITCFSLIELSRRNKFEVTKRYFECDALISLNNPLWNVLERMLCVNPVEIFGEEYNSTN